MYKHVNSIQYFFQDIYIDMMDLSDNRNSKLYVVQMQIVNDILMPLHILRPVIDVETN